MALFQYEGVGIRGLSAAVTNRVIKNLEYTSHFSADDAKEIVEKTGIYERRFTDDNTTASDLCYAAADKLLEDLEIDRNEIEVLIFVSQTPDYRMPATAVILQDRLGLPKSTLAFDMNLGCSAFVYGLSVIYSLMERSGIKKALLLDGETRSKVYSPKDRMTAFIFGDGGVAGLIERDQKYGKSFFSLQAFDYGCDLCNPNASGSRRWVVKMARPTRQVVVIYR